MQAVRFLTHILPSCMCSDFHGVRTIQLCKGSTVCVSVCVSQVCVVAMTRSNHFLVKHQPVTKHL